MTYHHQDCGVFDLEQPCKHCGHEAYIMQKNGRGDRYSARCGGDDCASKPTDFYPQFSQADEAIKQRLSE